MFGGGSQFWIRHRHNILLKNIAMKTNILSGRDFPKILMSDAKNGQLQFIFDIMYQSKDMTLEKKLLIRRATSERQNCSVQKYCRCLENIFDILKENVYM